MITLRRLPNHGDGDELRQFWPRLSLTFVGDDCLWGGTVSAAAPFLRGRPV